MPTFKKDLDELAARADALACDVSGKRKELLKAGEKDLAEVLEMAKDDIASAYRMLDDAWDFYKEE